MYENRHLNSKHSFAAFRHAVAGAVEAATLRCREVSGNK